MKTFLRAFTRLGAWAFSVFDRRKPSERWFVRNRAHIPGSRWAGVNAWYEEPDRGD
jgi:hypothetical protein